MNKIRNFFWIVFCVFSALFIFSFGFVDKDNSKNSLTLYQVYLDGKKVGLIKNEESLYELINREQQEIKEQYNVNKVYPPEGLEVTPVNTYSTNILSAEEIYEKIKDEAPFTIEGYVVTIKPATEEEKPIVFNILNKEDLNVSIKNTVKSFIDENVLEKYISDTQEKIDDEGETLDNLYLKQEIRIKEALIPATEYIFTNSEDLSKYMLFGTLKEGGHYTVKLGDDIKSVATRNMLSVSEFLIANPQIVSENALLSVGQVLNISLINPLVDVVAETTSIERQNIKYETLVEYDNRLSSNTKYVKQEGSDGLVKVTYKNEVVNGVMYSAVAMSTEEITPTVNRILVVGGVNAIYVGDSTYWAWPTNKPYRISSNFGPRWGSWHYGIDITGTGYGSPIYAIQTGIAFSTGYGSDTGYFIKINHNNDYNSIYMHLSKILVSQGEEVVKGQVIGLMGSTGRSTGTHLHLGVWTGSSSWDNGRMIDPLLLYQ